MLCSFFVNPKYLFHSSRLFGLGIFQSFLRIRINVGFSYFLRIRINLDFPETLPIFGARGQFGPGGSVLGWTKDVKWNRAGCEEPPSPRTPSAALLLCPDARRQPQILDLPLRAPGCSPLPSGSARKRTGRVFKPGSVVLRRQGERSKGNCRPPQAAPLPLLWGRNQPLRGCGGDGGALFVYFNNSSFHQARAGRDEAGPADRGCPRGGDTRPRTAIYRRQRRPPRRQRRAPGAAAPGAGDGCGSSSPPPSQPGSPPLSFSSRISSLPSITACRCRFATAAVTRLWLRGRKMSRLSAAEPRTLRNTRQINEVREIRGHKSEGCKSSCCCSYLEVEKSECHS